MELITAYEYVMAPFVVSSSFGMNSFGCKYYCIPILKKIFCENICSVAITFILMKYLLVLHTMLIEVNKVLQMWCFMLHGASRNL